MSIGNLVKIISGFFPLLDNGNELGFFKAPVILELKAKLS